MIRNSESSNLMDRTFSGASDAAVEAALLMRELRKFLSEDGGYETLKEILTSARDMTRTTSSLVEKNLQLMASALEDINEITDRLGRSSREDVERLSAILKNTASLTERMDRLLAENDQGLSETLTGMRDGMAKLNAALDDVRSVTAKINSGEGNVGKLVNDDRLYDKIVGISTQVEEYVNSTIGMDLQVAFQSDYLLSAGEARSQFGLRLEPRGKNKYYALGLVDSPRQSEKKVTTTTVIDGSDPPATGTNYITYETERQRQLLINAQIARRFGLFTLRGGAIESTAGLGLDFQPASGLSLSAEVFDFRQKKGPYLRLSGFLYPFFNPALANPLNWIYLSGGADNLLSDRRDYFLGLGLRFTDNDLKGIAGYIPMK